jgi:uncharacterized protein YceK
MKKFKILVASLILIMMVMISGCGEVRVNIDMTKLSSQSVQSEVYKMQKSSTANDYLGKTIKMRAKAYADGDYHYIIGPDGDACCNWEIEIRLSDSLESFPKTGKNTYVTGEYKYEKTGGITNYFLELIEYT